MMAIVEAKIRVCLPKMPSFQTLLMYSSLDNGISANVVSILLFHERRMG